MPPKVHDLITSHIMLTELMGADEYMKHYVSVTTLIKLPINHFVTNYIITSWNTHLYGSQNT